MSRMPSRLKIAEKKCPKCIWNAEAQVQDKNERHVGEESFGKQNFFYFKIAH